MPVDRRITRTDVARYAQVSKATVSYVLNHQASQNRISPTTIERVQQAIDALGYLPKHSAQAFQSGQSRSIAILCERDGPDMALLRHAISARARDHGWYAGHAAAALTTDTSAAIQDVRALVRSRRFQGYVLIGDGREGPGRLDGLPLERTVLIGDCPDRTVNCCRWDAAADAALLAQHLRACGCRSAMLVHDHLPEAGQLILAQDLGQALQTAGITSHLQDDPGASGTDTALVGLGDAATVRCHAAALSEDGTKPRPVCGFGTWRGDLLHPPVSGCPLPWEAIAGTSVDMLVHRLEDGPAAGAPELCLMAGALVVAESTRQWLTNA